MTARNAAFPSILMCTWLSLLWNGIGLESKAQTVLQGHIYDSQPLPQRPTPAQLLGPYSQPLPIEASHLGAFVDNATVIDSRPSVAQATAFASLANSIRDAASNFDAHRVTEPETAKRNFIARVSDVIEFLDQKTSPANRDAWLEYLDIEELVKAIQNDGSIGVIGRESLGLQKRLVGTAPGLELETIRALRVAVNDLVPALRFRDKEKTTKILAKQLNSIADELAEMNGVPTVDQMSTANQTLSLLTETKQTSPAANLLRQRFSHPNLNVWVGESVVQRFASRPVDETKPVNDCILGTALVGSARLTGSVSAKLIPMHGSVGLNISMSACMQNQNTGYRKPVTLQTSGYGNVFASRNIYVNETGVSMNATQVAATLKTHIDSIQHRLRIVRKIARKKAAEQKPQADRVGLEKLRRQVADQFTEETNKAANIAIPDFMAKVRPVLLRLDFPEPIRAIGSTSNAVYLQSTIGRSDQLAAPVPAPPIAESYEAAIQIHESLVNNTIGYLLSGRTIGQNQIDQLMNQADPSPSNDRSVLVKDGDEQKDEEDTPFEIDFAKSRPIIFEARDGKIRLGIRGTRFAQGRRALKRELEVSALYSPATTADGVVMLVRDGEVDIDFPGKRKLSISQAGMKAPIKKNFSKVFPETLMHQPLPIPAKITSPALAGRVYRPRLVQANNGWFTVLLK